MPATQPLDIPVDLSDAAHVILTSPVHLDSQGHLWITSAKAAPTSAALLKPLDDQTHVIRDVAKFVHWFANDSGDWSAAVVVELPDRGRYELITARSRTAIGSPSTHYHWDRAISIDQQFAVPTDDGVSVFTPDVGGTQAKEDRHVLTFPDTSEHKKSAVRLTRDAGGGVIAWAPWDGHLVGSQGALRYSEGKWTELSKAQGWPERIVHLVPLLDGTVLQIARPESEDESGADAITLTSGLTGSAVSIDEPHIGQLVEDMSDADSIKRQNAFNELTRYGPGIWPILEKLAEDQPPEASVRLRRLLRNKTEPTIGPIKLTEKRLIVASRQDDGTIIFYAPAGATVSNSSTDRKQLKDAWISIKPGPVIELLDEALAKDIRPDKCTLVSAGNEWVVAAPDRGVRRFVGNGFVPLLKGDERKYHRLVGIDRRGRWLLRAPIQTSTTQPSLNEVTLLIDTTILDPTPRLPVWLMTMKTDESGWDRENWPAYKSGGIWVLKEHGWESRANEPGTPLFVEPTGLPSDPSTIAPAPAINPTTTPAVVPETPLLTTTDGTKYFDGIGALRSEQRDGRTTNWPLPTSATGTGKAILLRANDGTLFLFNQPGRVLRIKPTPNEAEPFTLEATFTRDIPNVDHPRRIWLDPAGRIVMAYEKDRLAVMFPSGHVPREIALMMPERVEPDEP